MEDSDFSDDFCRFIQAAIPSVEAAELLLLLRREPERWWQVAEARAKLKPLADITDSQAARYFELLRSASMLASAPDGRIQYHPATGDLDGHGRALAQAYEQRPVTLIRMIYALRDKKIHSFAEAFRLRRS